MVLTVEVLVILAEEVPGVFLAEQVLGIVLAEGVIMVLPSWTYTSVVSVNSFDSVELLYSLLKGFLSQSLIMRYPTTRALLPSPLKGFLSQSRLDLQICCR